MTTVRQLAKLAGVSPSTVSRALRGDRYVRPEVRQRVEEFAALYHYRPNRLTQSLTSGTTYTLGCILPSVILPFYARLLLGVLKEAYLHSYRVVILEAHSDIAHTRQAIHTLVDQRVDGLLIGSEQFTPLPRDSVLEMWGQGVVPINIDCTQFETRIDTVGTDETAMAKLAVDYLVKLGHRRIAFVGLVPKGAVSGRPWAFADAMVRHGLPTNYFEDTGTLSAAEFDVRDILDRLLAHAIPPTAIIAWEDHLAAKLMQHVSTRGLRVPDDISILGISNHEMAGLLTPPLTSIEQYPEEIGRQAVRLVLRRLEEGLEGQQRNPEFCPIPCRLIQRSSCAAPHQR